ncbi:DUF4169 family protein [uncultured Lentibacter sp.]|jgi:hypothetical protein|uniref:DUF4169 family protein n=1 Tax=uncultured Lentibacter sp. TaxID=1659309 RepID=UPI00260A7ACF|nr:DUF4169 family protein [uncultured Lentibacter sp.]
MTEPVNLNRFRKAAARAKHKARAAENVVKHGRTKAQKELEKARAAKTAHELSGKERER